MKIPAQPALRALILATLPLLPAVALARPEPMVVIIPAPGKPPDLFAQEDEACRAQAEEMLDTRASPDPVVGSAVVGTVIGAAAGAAMGGRHDHTAAGAVTGLIMGTAAGLNRSAAMDRSAQRHFEVAYERCMVAKGNQLPGVVYRQVAPAPPPPPPPSTSASSPGGAYPAPSQPPPPVLVR
jgi:hypothetical protein